MLKISPSKTPQPNPTTGMVYVTEVEKTGSEICMSLLKMIIAIPVPIIPRITTYKTEMKNFGILSNISNGKPRLIQYYN